eukprot:m.186373 g.186373  ORF g.186373 m.186373 type:complete len:808 (+) comp32264_c0_seq1:198-2621(+)
MKRILKLRSKSSLDEEDVSATDSPPLSAEKPTKEEKKELKEEKKEAKKEAKKLKKLASLSKSQSDMDSLEFDNQGLQPITEELSNTTETEGAPRIDRRRSMVANMIKFRIVLDKAEHLAVADKSGTSDPYVKLKLGKSKKLGEYTSKVVWKTLFPVWGDECILYCNAGEDDLSITVYDSDGKLSKDDYLGGAKVRDLATVCAESDSISPSLEPLKKDDKLQKEIKFRGDAEGALGRVFLRVYRMDNDESPDVKKDAFTNNMARINVISASNLLGITKRPEQYKAAEHQLISQFQPMCEVSMAKKNGKVKKFNSKVVKKTCNPEFKQGWELSMNEGYSVIVFSIFDKGAKSSDSLIGRTWIDASTFAMNQFTELQLPLFSGDGAESEGLAHAGTLRVCVTVEALFQEDDDDDEVSEISAAGRLDIRVIRARKLAVLDTWTSDPFCVVEVDNCRRRTHVEKKSLSPHWNRSFTFKVHDIFGDVTIKIFDDDGGNEKDDFMGMVVIPYDLITNSGGPKWFALKEADCLGRAKGEIEIEISFELNSVVRSIIYVLNHRKEDFVDSNIKWKLGHLKTSIARLTNSVKMITSVLQVVDKIRKWEYGIVWSLLALAFYCPFVLLFEPWMLPAIGVLIFTTTYICHNQSSDANKARRLYPVDGDLESDSDSDDDDDDKNDKPKKGLLGKYKMIMEIGQTVQDVTDLIASLLERIKNLLNWTVPALTHLIVLLLSLVAVVLYFVPIKYFILIIGIAVFAGGFKKKYLSKPKKKKIPLIVDLLSRVPSDMDIGRTRRLQSQDGPSRTEMAKRAMGPM